MDCDDGYYSWNILNVHKADQKYIRNENGFEA